MKKMSLLICLISILMLSSCSWYVRERTNVLQGNILTPEKLAQVRKGMSKREVVFILGNPVYNNVFSDNRWDYVYTRQIRAAHPTVKTVSYTFVDNRVSQIKS